MEYNSEYGRDPQQNGDGQQYGYGNEQRTLKGYKVLLLLLTVILAAISMLYFSQIKTMRNDFMVERDTLTNRISTLISDIDNIQVTNDTLTQSLSMERNKADSLPVFWSCLFFRTLHYRRWLRTEYHLRPS